MSVYSNYPIKKITNSEKNKMLYSIKEPFSIDIQNARKHPQLTNEDMLAINALKKSGKYEDWNTLFTQFLADLEVVPIVKK